MTSSGCWSCPSRRRPWGGGPARRRLRGDRRLPRRHGRPPAMNPADVGEAKLAMRLRAMCESDEQRRLLERSTSSACSPSQAARHARGRGRRRPVRPALRRRRPVRAAARPEAADDAPRRGAASAVRGLRRTSGSCSSTARPSCAPARELLPFKNPSQIEPGRFFVQNGVLVYVAEVGERTTTRSGRPTRARAASSRTGPSRTCRGQRSPATSTRTAKARDGARRRRVPADGPAARRRWPACTSCDQRR